MRNKALGAVVVAVGLSAAILYEILRPDICSVEDVLAVYREDAEYGDITIDRPLDETLFPPEMVAPRFIWNDSNSVSKAWLIRIRFADNNPCMYFLRRRQEWTPRPDVWENIKIRSLQRDAHFTVLGVDPAEPLRILSRAKMSFRTSRDPVAAPLFYREVSLPFVEADRNLSAIRWRFGSIASAPPPVVLENLPACGNCHSFTPDGKTLAMDVDYASRKGSYVITDVKEQMVLTPEEIITWADPENSQRSHGLLSQISPDGRYVISTVKDMSLFVTMQSLAFSQLFFPVKGIL
jgi:hypothetical protein